MKYKDIKYYITKDYSKNIDEIRAIHLSEDLFNSILKETGARYTVELESFEYDGLYFILQNHNKNKNYAVIFLNDSMLGCGYKILSENERLIKDIIE